MLKINKIKPMSTRMVVTGDRFEEDMYNNGLIENKKGDLKTYQTVLEVGPMVRNVKPGDKVVINFMHYAILEHDPNSVKADMGMQKIKKFAFNWVELYDGDEKKDCLYIDEQDIIYAYEGKEVQGSKLITPEKQIII